MSGERTQGTLLLVRANGDASSIDHAALEHAGYQLHVVEDTDAEHALATHAIDAVLLDGLREPGWRFLRAALGVHPNLPVLVSCSLESRAVIGLLDIGIACHVDPAASDRLLLARIAWARRRAKKPEEDNGPSLEIDDKQRRVWLNGAPLDMPRREFDVLAILMMNVGNIITRERLMQSVWGSGYKAGSRSLDVRVSRIRKLLREEGGEDSPSVETVPGVGYRLIV